MQSHFLPAAGRTTKIISGAMQKTLFQYGMDAYHLYRGSEASMELPDIEIAQGCRKETLEEWATHAKLPVYVDTGYHKTDVFEKTGIPLK